jgi:hypothetical protein
MAMDGSEKDKYLGQGIFLDEDSTDLSHSSFDPSLSKVWHDPQSGELCASVDRLTFEPLSVIVQKFLEPNGFALNLENLLACLDSMRVGLFAKAGTAKGGKHPLKKHWPMVYMRQPQKHSRGFLLGRFYEEINRYEAELTRLQQFESQSRRQAQEAVKDESGRALALQLMRDNDNLKQEINRLAARLQNMESAMRDVPIAKSDVQLPSGSRSCTVRSIQIHDQTVHFSSEKGQFSWSLKLLGGVPEIGARGIAIFEGGSLRQVLVYEPRLRSFDVEPGVIKAVDGTRIKIEFADRTQQLYTLDTASEVPPLGSTLVVTKYQDQLIDIQAPKNSVVQHAVDKVFDRQTRRQLRRKTVMAETEILEAEIVETMETLDIKNRRRVS